MVCIAHDIARHDTMKPNKAYHHYFFSFSGDIRNNTNNIHPFKTVYPSGLVCISILHPAGDDPNHYEHASERWSPIQSVEKILLSVMNLLAEPNDESPANVDAAKMWRDRRDEYDKKVRESVRRSLGL